MACSIRVCVLEGHSARILWGKLKLDPVGATGNHRFGEIRVCAWGRFAQFLMAETAHAEIRVCVGRFAK